MSALRAWLRQNRLAARPLRAAVSLLLAVVLVAGGTSFAERAVGGEAAPSAAVEGQSDARPAPAALRDGEHLLRAASVACGHDVTPRWLDLRSGGLPAPRAPDAVAAPRLGC